MWLIILAGVLVAVIYFTIIKPLKYWKEKAVPYVKPWPIFGNIGPFVFRQRVHAHLVQDVYNAFPSRRYCGFYTFNQPALILRDPDLIKKITVKEFDTFPDHRPFLPEDVDPLWSKNLFGMRGGEKWYDMRSTLSPSFTSSKMRMMFELMKEVSNQFSNHFLKQKGTVTAEMKDTFTRFANDVIATTAFGISCDSLQYPDNEFLVMGKETSSFTGIKQIMFLLHLTIPTVAKLLKIPVISKDASKFFRTVIKDTIKIRQEKSVMRPDMIHLLLEARKGRLKHDENVTEIVDSGFAVLQESEIGKVQKLQKPQITDEDITAQALIFFLGGFDSVSTMMCYATHELAVNPDVQEKLRQEVDDTLEKAKGELTYEDLLGMKYLDMVVTETLRKWPSFTVSDRMSVRPFTIEPEHPGEKPLHLEAGSVCSIPVYAIQRDAQYYPNPDKFDPERFSEENKHNIKPFTYLPFGAGPRSCIASRFALLEGKLIIAEIISKFEIVPVAKTQIPLQLSKGNFFPIPDGGFWLGLKPRKVSS